MPLSASRLALILVVTAIPAAVIAEDFVTAKGKTVAMPEISTMTCEQIEITLARIDSTRYRENAPVNPDPADDVLFVYEQNLAQALFRVCVEQSRSGMKDENRPRQQAGKQ